MDPAIPPRRILVLDDEPGILELLESYLRSLGFEPLATSRWTQAVDLITHNPPDLILLDLQMPTIQGDAILGFIRQQGHNLPVIVVSAYLDDQKVESLRRLGATDFVSKPFQLSALGALVRKTLNLSDAAAAPSSAPAKDPPDAPGSDLPAGPADTPVPSAPEEPAYSVLDHEVAEATAVYTKAVPPPQPDPHPHPRRHHHHRRQKPANFKLYVVVSLVCLIGSLVVLLIEKLPAYFSSSLEQAVEKSVQSEARRQIKGIESLSDRDREALKKMMEKGGR